jgi:beta-glucosidase-like glycosyl hydrolase
VLRANKSGVLSLNPSKAAKIAVIGPNTDDTSALFACYSFANHVLEQHPHLLCAGLLAWHAQIGMKMVRVHNLRKEKFDEPTSATLRSSMPSTQRTAARSRTRSNP